MLLAVNMPEQEPQVGQPACSRASSSAARDLAVLLCRGADEDVDEVDFLAVGRAAGLHRPAADEDRRDVAADGAHQHAGDDLVAVGNADHPVEAMGLDHRLDAVGDQLAAGERILHALVAHGDAVVDADRVEDKRRAAGLADALLNELADLVEVDVTGNDVHVAVADGDERFLKSPSLNPVARSRLRWGARASPSLTVSDRMIFSLWCGKSLQPFLFYAVLAGKGSGLPAARLS